MSLVREIRRRAKHVTGPTLGILAVGYFLYHSVEGDRGVLAWMQIRQQIQREQAVLATTEAERKTLEAHVALLRRDNLDRDMLDEQARRVLGLIGEREIVIFEGVRKPAS